MGAERARPAARRGGDGLLLIAAAKERGEESLRLHLRHRRHRRAAARLDLGPRFFIARHGLAARRQMHGLAIREQTRKLVLAHARPGPDIADVQMDERRASGRIIADAAPLQAHGDLAHTRHWDVQIMHVHRLSEHVLGKFRDGLGAAAQHGVGLGRAIGGDHVDGLLRAGFAIGLPDHVEEPRVHFHGFIVAPVAQEIVQLLQRRLIVLAIDAKGRLNALAGMGVMKTNGAGVAIGDGGLGARRRNRRQQQGEGAGPGVFSGGPDLEVTHFQQPTTRVLREPQTGPARGEPRNLVTIVLPRRVNGA